MSLTSKKLPAGLLAIGWLLCSFLLQAQQPELPGLAPGMWTRLSENALAYSGTSANLKNSEELFTAGKRAFSGFAGRTTASLTGTDEAAEKSTPEIHFTDTSFTYDGSRHGHTATASDTSGNLDLSLSYTYEGINGTSYTKSAVAPINAGNYKVTATFEGNNEYNPATGSASYIIEPRPIVVMPNFSRKKYGDPDPQFTWSIVGGSLVPGDAITGTLTRFPGEDIGAYDIEQNDLSAGPNYNIIYEFDVLYIEPRPLTIRATDRTKECGAEMVLGTTAYTATGLASYDSITGVTLNSNGTRRESLPSVYSIFPSRPQGIRLYNYVIDLKPGQLTVSDQAAPVPVRQQLPDTTIAVGAPLRAPAAADACTGIVTGTSSPMSFSVPGNYSVTWRYMDSYGNSSTQLQQVAVRDTTAPVDTQKVTPTVRFTETNFIYDGLSHAPSAIASADTQTLSLPFTYTYEGVDTTTYAKSTTAPVYAGAYKVIAAFKGDSTYAAVTDSVSFTIEPRSIVVMPDHKSKIYGDPDPQFTWSIVGGSLVPGDAITGTLTRYPGEDAGAYDIEKNNLSAGPNYYLIYEFEVLYIEPRPITIRASDRTKECGTAMVLGTTAFTTTGLLQQDTITGVTLNSNGARRESTIGVYPIFASNPLGIDRNNYKIDLKPGQLTVSDQTGPVPVREQLPDTTIVIGRPLKAPAAIDACTRATVSGTTDSMSYSVPGNYTVTWQFSDGNGNTSTQTQKVAVRGLAIAEVSVSASDTAVCSGSPVTFTARPVFGGDHPLYQWRLNGQVIPGATDSVYTSSSLVQGDTISVVMTSNDPSVRTPEAVSEGVTVKVVAPKLPGSPGSVTGPSPVCPGAVHTYTIAEVMNALTYNWIVPAGATILSGQGTTTVEISFGSSYASGSLKVTAANCMGTSPARSYSVARVTKPGTPGVISGGGTVCAGQVKTFTIAPVNNTTSYEWTVPANTLILSGQGTTTVEVAFGALYTSGAIKVTASNCGGSSLPRSLTVALPAKPGTPGNITGAPRICLATTVTYSIAPVANTTSYNWTVPAHAFIVSGQGTTSVHVAFDSAFVKGVLGVTASNCGGTSGARLLTVTQLARPNTPGTITGTTAPACGVENSYSIAAVSGASYYSWTAPAHATIVAGQGTTRIRLMLEPGFAGGALSVRAVNCRDSSAARSLVLGNSEAMSCTETPAGAVSANLATEREEGLTVTAAPNPSDGEFSLRITAAAGSTLRVRVFNAIGHMVEARANVPPNTILKLGSDYRPGVYLAEVVQGSERKVIRLIKK